MHQPTLRVIEVLNYILYSENPKKLADISRNLNISKSTLVPILQTLCQNSYISRNSHGEYTPGITLFSMGSSLLGKFPFMEYVKEKLKHLVAVFGETCYFGVLDKGNVHYLEKEDSPNPLRMLVNCGKRLPAYATGIGKALLCDKSKNQILELYPDGFLAITPNTITNADTLCAELAQFNKQGYCEEVEESTEHIRCLSVPVKKNGAIRAAVSIAIPVFRYDENLREHIITELKNTAFVLSQALEKTDAQII